MQSWKVVLFLLCQSSGLKYNEAPECAGDVTGATPAGCDELGADGCDGKYTSVEGGVYSQCKVSGSNCLAVGPLCKKPESASMTCSSLSDCEGKGWKQTWTSGTATTYSEDLRQRQWGDVPCLVFQDAGQLEVDPSLQAPARGRNH